MIECSAISSASSAADMLNMPKNSKKTVAGVALACKFEPNCRFPIRGFEIDYAQFVPVCSSFGYPFNAP